MLFAVDKKFNGVNTGFVRLFGHENFLDSLSFLSECTHCREEVAVAESALSDIGRLNLIKGCEIGTINILRPGPSDVLPALRYVISPFNLLSY